MRSSVTTIVASSITVPVRPPAIEITRAPTNAIVAFGRERGTESAMWIESGRSVARSRAFFAAASALSAALPFLSSFFLGLPASI